MLLAARSGSALLRRRTACRVFHTSRPADKKKTSEPPSSAETSKKRPRATPKKRTGWQARQLAKYQKGMALPVLVDSPYCLSVDKWTEQLQVLQSSAILSPRWYIHKTSKGEQTSISGSLSAKRLLRGQQDFVHIVQGQLVAVEPPRMPVSPAAALEDPRYARQRPQPVILDHHGIPVQLLQYLVDWGYHWLTNNPVGSATEATLHNFHVSPSSSQQQQYTGDVGVPVIVPHLARIRTTNPDTTRIVTIQGDEDEGADHESSLDPSALQDTDSLELYLTMAERLVRKLSVVLSATSPASKSASTTMDDSETTSTKKEKGDGDDSQDEDFIASPLLFPHTEAPPHWKVDIFRGHIFPIKNTQEETATVPPLLLVQFVAGSSTWSLGHIIITLQGYTTTDQLGGDDHPNEQEVQIEPMTLRMDAGFRKDSQ